MKFLLRQSSRPNTKTGVVYASQDEALRLPISMWEALGRPETIAVTVEPEDTAAMTYTCATCGKPVTVAHAAEWPSRCPHCKTAPPTLILKPTKGT